MTITKTHSRKTKNNDYRRYLVEDGLLCWYIHTNKGLITYIRERLYQADKDDVVYERVIPRLPAYVQLEFNNIK